MCFAQHNLIRLHGNKNHFENRSRNSSFTGSITSATVCFTRNVVLHTLVGPTTHQVCEERVGTHLCTVVRDKEAVATQWLIGSGWPSLRCRLRLGVTAATLNHFLECFVSGSLPSFVVKCFPVLCDVRHYCSPVMYPVSYNRRQGPW